MKKKKISTAFKAFFGELFAHILVALIFIALCVVGIFIIDFLPEKVADVLVEAAFIIGFFAILILLWFISKIINILHKIKKENIDSDTTTSQEKKQ